MIKFKHIWQCIKYRGKINKQKIFLKNNHIFVFINLKISFCLVIILVMDQNILDLIISLIFFSIQKKNFGLEILKH